MRLLLSLFITGVLGFGAACGDPHHDDDWDMPDVDTERLSTEATLSPARMNKDADWAAVIAGTDFVCGLKQAGSLWCAGNNDSLQFGRASEPRASEFIRIGEEYWASVSVGRRASDLFACGVTRGGRLLCWGHPVDSQTGKEPAEANLLASHWTQVSSGGQHVCGVTNGGDLACFGVNDAAQLGVTGGNKSTPVVIDGSGLWVQASAGNTHSCGVQTGGALYCWGDPMQTGANGALTEGPTQVSSSAAWSMVAAGDNHTCAVRTNGTLWCWGNGESGQLGIGATNDRWLIPVQVGEATDWAEVAVGANHTCALRESGQLYCWGANEYGQLGNGSRILKDRPALVKSSYAWTSVSLHSNQTCGVRSDGTLWCWGRTVTLE
jgi:alpha-tubulin suppressor-like RCC1 family protein